MREKHRIFLIILSMLVIFTEGLTYSQCEGKPNNFFDNTLHIYTQKFKKNCPNYVIKEFMIFLNKNYDHPHAANGLYILFLYFCDTQKDIENAKLIFNKMKLHYPNSKYISKCKQKLLIVIPKISIILNRNIKITTCSYHKTVHDYGRSGSSQIIEAKLACLSKFRLNKEKIIEESNYSKILEKLFLNHFMFNLYLDLGGAPVRNDKIFDYIKKNTKLGKAYTKVDKFRSESAERHYKARHIYRIITAIYANAKLEIKIQDLRKN